MPQALGPGSCLPAGRNSRHDLPYIHTLRCLLPPPPPPAHFLVQAGNIYGEASPEEAPVRPEQLTNAVSSCPRPPASPTRSLPLLYPGGWHLPL
jgi:hypothetical protein